MKSDQYYISELEDKILEAVYKQTKDIPRPWGIILSGGFDSGLLAALTEPDYVYSMAFPYGPKYDEGRYRDAVINHLGLVDRTTVITFTKEDFLTNLKEAVRIMGEPVSHFSLAPFNLLMKNVRLDMHILSGEGPDEYLGGYSRQIIFDELNKLNQIPELRNYKEMIPKALGFNNLINQYAIMMGYSYAEASKYFYLYGYPLQGAIGKMDMELGVIEKMEQKLAQAYGVNLHYPYINDVFAEYCYKLPDHLKIRNGVTKWIFREICKKYLPEMMWDRAKMGGPVAPINQWIENSAGEFDKTAYINLQKEILNAA